MTPKRTAILDRVTSDHLLKSDPAAADLDAAFAADLRFARMMGEVAEIALMQDSEFDALNRQDAENRAAIDDDFAMFR